MTKDMPCSTPICLACGMGPCANQPVNPLRLALEQIERIAASKGMADADRKAALRDIREHARTAIARATEE